MSLKHEAIPKNSKLILSFQYMLIGGARSRDILTTFNQKRVDILHDRWFHSKC